MKKTLAIALLAASAFVAPVIFTAASASTVTFATPNWVYNNTANASWRVLIDDFTAGQYRVKVSIDGAPLGDLLALGFDSDLTGLTSSSVTHVSSSTGDAMTGFFGNGTNNQVTCGLGCNFNGIGQAFDYIVVLGVQGSASGLNTYWEFLIAHPVLSLLNSFTQVGIRAQTIGTSGVSAKDYNNTPTYCQGLCAPVETVPLPAALPLLLGGLGGLAWLGRHRKRNSLTAA